MNQILECVPNFSEGRDLSVIEKLCDCFRGKPGVRLLDYTWDQDHNRCVLTIIGEPEPLRDAVVESIGRAVELIDMTKHQGQHPRMGCVDVVPFIPIRNTTVGDADRIAKETAQLASQRFGQPFFLYEKSATAPHRANLADVRKGQFEGMAEKMKDPMWRPDYGPATIHPTGGVTASFASLGDIILAEPGALIGFAGPRVIQQTIGQTLPEGFQRAEYQEEHGFVDAVVPRSQMRETLVQLLLLHEKGGREWKN